MRISFFNQFGALNSAPVFDSFTQSVRKLGHEVVYHEYNADAIVIWSLLFNGRMKPNKAVWEYARRMNIPVIVLEVGCLHRGTTWKVGVNGFQLRKPFTHSRSSTLGIHLHDWMKTGDNILICGQRTTSNLWPYGDYTSWLTALVNDIRMHSDRPIIFRPHPRERIVDDFSKLGIEIQYPSHISGTYDDFDYEESLKNTWIVINPTSNPGNLAIIHGCPAIVDETSLAKPMSTHLKYIENPRYPNREQWLEQLCHTEWTIEELSDPQIVEQLLIDINI